MNRIYFDKKQIIDGVQMTLNTVETVNRYLNGAPLAIKFEQVGETEWKLTIMDGNDIAAQKRKDEEDLRRLHAEQRKTWVDKWYNAYWNDANAGIVYVAEREGYISAYRIYTNDEGRKRMAIGEAWCNPTDEFDDQVGVAIAYARTHNEPIPDYI